MLTGARSLRSAARRPEPRCGGPREAAQREDEALPPRTEERRPPIRYLKGTVTGLIALLAGLVGLALVFTDIGPGDTPAGRAISGALFFVVVGLAIGLLNPRGRRWLLSGLAAWGLAALGVVGVVVSLTDPVSGDLGLALGWIVGPLACALLGGYVGARLARGRRSISPAAT